MGLLVYFGMALIALEADALACTVSGTKFRLFAGAILALVWPLSAILVVVSVVMSQNTKPDANENDMSENKGEI